MSMCRVFSCIVGRGCLLWPVRSLGKTLLAFALFHFGLQSQICLLLQVSIYFLLLHSSPLWWKGHLFWELVLEGLVGLHRTVQLQLLQHYWLGHRLGLPWYWMVSLGNKQIILSFMRLHQSTSFWTLLLTMMATPFLPTVVDIMVIWVKFTHSSLSLLQWIFLTQELNRGLLHCRQILYQLSYQGSPILS